MSNQDQEKPASHIVDRIEADDNPFSDAAESLDTDLTALATSIRHHVYENGRRYHSPNAGAYVMPNDGKEQDRLDMFHHTINMMLGGELHVVKLPRKLDRVLDLGSGTGIWAIDFADEHPGSAVIGVDLSPIHPSWYVDLWKSSALGSGWLYRGHEKQGPSLALMASAHAATVVHEAETQMADVCSAPRVPPNCTFEFDDVEKSWIWNAQFDFIHSANIGQGIHDWPSYTKRMFDNLAPGGVVQLHETQAIIETDDNTIPKNGGIETYVNLLKEAANLAELKWVSEDLEGYLLDAGFVDVRVVIKKVPIGPWAKEPKMKELGRWGLAILSIGLSDFGLNLFTRVSGKSTEEATQICDAALAEFRRRDVHSYSAQWFVEGRKPAVGEAN